MTTAYTDVRDPLVADEGVYAPQEDSRLLIEVMDGAALARGRHVVDLCTGSGVVAIGAAEQGAASVTALDICPRAVRCARTNALGAGVSVDVHLGSWARAVEFGPFDLVVCNPPYVPHDPAAACDPLPAYVGPARAWDAGYDGRLVLDPLCVAVPEILDHGGSLLLVQSEFADPRRTLGALASVGLDAEIVARQWIPFGPVLTSRAEWLETTGRLEPGRREEELLVIRADKP
ncbi:HemK2/MTQ2 family protein methyltransferase [Mycolicibacterium celeriflavum]|uniref:Methylase n=1 Tax=Mycolicibacterium celeriflavum TaxID=1249101 RepID=A0A1X0C0P9_MYCCF|nr:HemK2/MTQ2 family protein methyltransferase [Mycolicibacterium celeriflavum]MCV7239061.1 methyltransferase [Mycolicibacterium celeriflavum]ORA50407.1 methylase [Mycolicibacterium celeriflavum]BBY45301.1 methylase [Mycolicibacterium celeriflavum]